eukprot:SAG31_NODE_2011_length_6669_cov_2.063927_1_plen_86_part_00
MGAPHSIYYYIVLDHYIIFGDKHDLFDFDIDYWDIFRGEFYMQINKVGKDLYNKLKSSEPPRSRVSAPATAAGPSPSRYSTVQLS